MAKDHYKILGVPRDATEEQIKHAYRKLVKRHHPDVAGEEGGERIKEINEAYAVLGDPEKRARHDRGMEGRGWESFGGPGGFNIFFNGGVFSFGPGGPRQARPPPAPPPPLEIDLVLDLGEVFRGSARRFDYERPSQCRSCGGSGARDGEVRPCPECHGLSALPPFSSDCPLCHGRGKVPSHPCGDCSSGWRKEAASADLTIPRGLPPRGVISVPGAGALTSDGMAGDLFLRIGYAPHRFYEARFPDLSCSLPLTLEDAVFGCEAVVPSFHGRIKLKVAAGLPPGTVLRVPGKGLPKSWREDSWGDLLVRVEPEIPAAATREGGLQPGNLRYPRVAEYSAGLEALAAEIEAGGRPGNGV